MDPVRERNREKVFLQSGEELTPELEEELAAEAERGYDLSRATRYFLDRPLFCDDDHPRITLSFSPAEMSVLRRQAEDKGVTVGDLVREEMDRRSRRSRRSADL